MPFPAFNLEDKLSETFISELKSRKVLLEVLKAKTECTNFIVKNINHYAVRKLNQSGFLENL